MDDEIATPTPLPEDRSQDKEAIVPQPLPREIGGPKGPEPTRYGDWERKGRCYDF